MVSGSKLDSYRSWKTFAKNLRKHYHLITSESEVSEKMEFVSSLLNTAMERVLGVLLPNPNGACALLRRLMDELDELKHLNTTDSLDFPGSTMSFTPPERCIWMKDIYEDRPIGQIVWPATHNSATNKIGINFITRPFGQHQTLSIYYQLRYGVRALDIRVQQDGRVCNGNFLTHSMTDVITDIKKFMFETLYEVIILEIRTERGYTDPPDFESYLVHELGDLLIKQDDHVFSKTISQVLPGRIICIWKPNNSPKPSEGGPIWSASYLRGDVFETELPLTKFKANLINLSQQIPASKRNYFYKVEHVLTPQASGTVEWMLVWPRHAKVVSKRINEFARLFLSNCNSKDILDRLQIYSTDFINDDFIVACIALNHSMDIKEYRERMEMIMQKHRQDLEELENKFEDEIRDQQMMMQKLRQDLEEKVSQVKNLEEQLETTKQKSIENILLAVTKEAYRATQIQRGLKKFQVILGLRKLSTMASGGEVGHFAFSSSCVLKIQKGDITQWFVDGSSDAIVNPANERMLGGSGADGAIHRAAGQELGEACYKVPEIRTGVRCPTGQARITPGFKLPCSHVIHTVGPIYYDDENPETSLKNAYRNSFSVAKENNIQYIAFPAISCGIQRYPYEEAATIALASANEFSKDFKEVHFVLLMDDIYNVWMKKASDWSEITIDKQHGLNN